MHRKSQSNRRIRRVALLVLPCLLVACGTRLTHEEHLAAAGGAGATGSNSTGAAASAAAGAGASTAAGSTGASGGTAGSGAAGAGSAAGGPGAELEGAVAGAAEGSAATPGSPIRIGMIGNFGGIAGASFVPAREALKAWVASVNARGGINGHPVELLVADNGNEGARDLAIAKDFVENQGVIAIVNYFGGAGGPPAVAAYAAEVGVPVIGGLTTDQTWTTSTHLFPQTAGYDNIYFASARAMADQGMDKIAIVYCIEGSVCQENADRFRVHAEAMGLEVVYSAGVSLAQPDFTSECLNARSRGANAVYPQLDGNSVARMARSCGRQGFNPRFFLPAPVEPADPVLGNAIAVVPTFPWVLTSGSPALDEYGQAIAQYAPDVARNSFLTSGWMTGKVVELAAANMPEPPTAAAMLAGLWAMQNQTFGGISPAITYVQGQPAAPANCAFYMEIQDGQWTAPRGAELYGCM